jgi:hypothetical protein
LALFAVEDPALLAFAFALALAFAFALLPPGTVTGLVGSVSAETLRFFGRMSVNSKELSSLSIINQTFSAGGK